MINSGELYNVPTFFFAATLFRSSYQFSYNRFLPHPRVRTKEGNDLQHPRCDVFRFATIRTRGAKTIMVLEEGGGGGGRRRHGCQV